MTETAANEAATALLLKGLDALASYENQTAIEAFGELFNCLQRNHYNIPKVTRHKRATKGFNAYTIENNGFPPTPRPGDLTPWGIPYRWVEHAPGIWEAVTGGNGGLVLSDERLAAMPKALRVWHYELGWRANYVHEGAYMLVALAFPEAFPKIDPSEASASAASAYPEAYQAWRQL